MSTIQRLLPKDPHHLVLFALPWLLLALNPSWPFGNGGNCDPWFYFGHFRDYPRIYFSNPCYDGERLPLVLPGHLLHLLFRPVVAQVILHVVFFYIAVFALYYILKQVQNQQTALLTATLLACNSFFLGALGW